MGSRHQGLPGGLGVRSVLEFDDPALLRAARLADVLHACGRVLANSTGTAETYNLSARAERIDVFISHNWALGRRRKFVLLAMHVNLGMACRMAITALALMLCLTHLLVTKGYWFFATQLPCVSTVTMLAFSTALFFGHETQALGCFRDTRSAFLDKVCIHQTDLNLKERGVLSLGAFLHKSDAMVVCFTGLYLKKLWTVYEFATFLLVRGEAHAGLVHVVPANLPLFTLAGSLCCFGLVVTAHLLPILGIDTTIFRALALIAMQFIMITISRRWARDQHEARALFKGFTFANASYVSEADHALVRRNIILMMRHFAHVGAEASDAEALLAFDEFVRTAGLRAFLESVGHLGAPYRLILPIQLVFLSDSLQWWSACTSAGCGGFTTAPQIAFQLLGFLTSVFLVIPLAVAIGFHFTKYCLGLRGAAGVAYCGAVCLLDTTALIVLDPMLSPLQPWLLGNALRSPRSSFGFLLYCATLFIVTALVYRQPQRQVHAPAAWPHSELPMVEPGMGTALEGNCEAAELDMSTALEGNCEVSAPPPSSPGQQEVAEDGKYGEPEVAVAMPDDCKLDLHGHIADACPVPPTMRRLGRIVEASGKVVELCTP